MDGKFTVPKRWRTTREEEGEISICAKGLSQEEIKEWYSARRSKGKQKAAGARYQGLVIVHWAAQSHEGKVRKGPLRGFLRRPAWSLGRVISTI